jgi:hypothetical protein
MQEVSAGRRILSDNSKPQAYTTIQRHVFLFSHIMLVLLQSHFLRKFIKKHYNNNREPKKNNCRLHPNEKYHAPDSLNG